MLALLAAMLSRGPQFVHGGLAKALPTTSLIFMLPWIEDHQSGSDWRAAAMYELTKNRLGLYGSASQSPEIWDWQWRIVCSRSLCNLEAEMAQLPAIHRRAARFRNSWHWAVLWCACRRGVLHRLGWADRFGAIVPPTLEAHVESPAFANGPVRVSFGQDYSQNLWANMWQAGADEDWPHDLQINFLDGEPIRWTIGDSPDQRDRYLLIWLPDVHGEIEIEMKSTMRVWPDPSANIETELRLPVRQVVRLHVSDRDTLLPPERDSQLDTLIRKDFRFAIDVQSPSPRVTLQLGRDLVYQRSEFNSYFWRVEILRNETIVQDERCAMAVTLNDAADWGSAQAEFSMNDAVTKLLRASLNGDDSAKWSIRLRMDQEGMLLWNYRPGITYWDGVIEQSIGLHQ